MKKIMITLVIIATVGSAKAQKGLGIEAGVRFANITGKDTEGNKIKTGFQLGVNYDIPLAGDIYVQPGLNFLQNGTRMKEDGDEGSITTNYLQVPALVRYRPEVGNGSFFVGIGPYLGFGIGKIIYKYDGETAKTNWEGLNKVDVGGKLQAGYQIENGLYFGIGFEKGFTKIAKDSKSYNTAFGITVGYRFTK